MGGVNLYQYADNPVSWVDPLGLSSEDTIRLRHYTNKSSAKKIISSKKIIASDNNRVYFEKASKKPLSPQKAIKKHKIKNADSFVETDVATSKIEEIKNPLTGKNELTVKGDVELDNATCTHRK
jgi:uncharacterized protein RhaS with RHS repeats